MKKNTIKFAGPSKKMMDALENEGLYVDWPKKIESEGDLAIEGTFYTGCDWEKIVTIDLRDEKDRDLSKKSEVDAAISRQLDEAYGAFDVDEEMKLNMEGSEEERAARGVPDAERLLADMKEQEERLRRFSIVADAVYRGKPVPKEEDPTEEMSLTAEEVLLIKAYRNYGEEGVKEWLNGK
jgi:hypothetical protein